MAQACNLLLHSSLSLPSAPGILHGRFFKGNDGRVRADAPCVGMRPSLIFICSSNVLHLFIFGMNFHCLLVFLPGSSPLYRMVSNGGASRVHLG